MSGFSTSLRKSRKSKQKEKAKSSFAEKFRKGFGGGKDLKKGKMKTQTTFQKIFGE